MLFTHLIKSNYKNIFLKNTNGAAKIASFSIVFLISKGLVFCTPLILSNLISDKSQYGNLEYEISFGTWLMIPISFGLHIAYPYFYLKKKQEHVKNILWIHFLFFFPLIIIVSIILLLNNIIGQNVFFSLLFASVILAQAFVSSVSKSNKYIKQAVLIDSGIYYLFFICIVFSYIFHLNTDTNLIHRFLGVYSLLFFIYFLLSYKKLSGEFNIKLYHDTIRFGIPSLFLFFVTVGITNSTRFWINFFIGAHEVAYYSLFFRLSGIIVVIQQLVIIVMFRKIYESEISYIDQKFSIFLLLMFAISIVAFLTIPTLAKPYFELLKNIQTKYKFLHYILSYHVLFWMINAVNEGIISRENLVKKVLVSYIFIFVSMIASFCIVNYCGFLGINIICSINLFFVFIANEVQFSSIRIKSGNGYWRIRLVNRLIFVLFIATSWLTT